VNGRLDSLPLCTEFVLIAKKQLRWPLSGGKATAATVWLAAAIGIACGVGQWMMVAGTVIGLIVLVVFIRIDGHFFGRFSSGDDNGDPLS
jgi:uncharacterized membrane protein YhiD involved in acid resistance